MSQITPKCAFCETRECYQGKDCFGMQVVREGDWKLVRPRMDIQYSSPNDEEAHKLYVQKDIE